MTFAQLFTLFRLSDLKIVVNELYYLDGTAMNLAIIKGKFYSAKIIYQVRNSSQPYGAPDIIGRMVNADISSNHDSVLVYENANLTTLHTAMIN